MRVDPRGPVSNNAALTSPASAVMFRVATPLVACGLFTLAVLFQWHGGAFSADYISDGALHYVTGLMVHEFVRQGAPGSPMSFAQEFHSHYAFVGLGLWPPLFYALEAVWFLVFSASRPSTVMLMATISTALGVAAFVTTARRLGTAIGLAVALFIVLMPLSKAASVDLLLDPLVALLALTAAAAYARYASSGQWRFSLVFGLLAAACLMTKGNGGLLALVPPAHILISGRWRLLRQWAFWLPVPIVALVVVPWYLLTYKLSSAGFLYEWGFGYTKLALVENARILLERCGVVAVALAAIGSVVAMRLSRQSEDQFWPSILSLLVSCLVFQAVVPTALEPRYLIAAAVSIAMLAGLGASSLATCVARRTSLVAGSRLHAHRRTAGLAVAVALVATVPKLTQAVPAPSFGFTAAAAQAMSFNAVSNPTMLIAAGPLGEGGIIAALAMLDTERPSIVAARGSRLLGGGGYKNTEYESRFGSLAEIEEVIADSGVALIVLERSSDAARWQHTKQLAQLIESAPRQYSLLSESVILEGKVEVYRVVRNAQQPGPSDKLLDYLKPRKSVSFGSGG